MGAQMESTITLKGKVNDLMKMLKYLINNEYFDDEFDLEELRELSDSELEKYINENGNKIELFIVGPYGRLMELPDTKIFEGLADLSPNATFEGELSCVWGQTEYSILSGN